MTYRLSGLSCAHCAQEIETAVRALPGVLRASLNFVSSTLRLELKAPPTPDFSAILAQRIQMIEAGIESVEAVSAHTGAAMSAQPPLLSRRFLALMATGAILFATALLGARFGLAPHGIIRLCFAASYLALGGEIVWKALRNLAAGRIFDENFLMTIATLGAFLLGDDAEAVAVMLFFRIGEGFQEAAVRRSRRSIAELMDIRPESATVKRNETLLTVAPEAVAVGETLLVRPGEKIPLDGKVLAGESALDTRALTGESMPHRVRPGDVVYSGTVNQGEAALWLAVSKSVGDSTASRILALVEEAAAKKAPTERFITTFSRYYTPAVVGLALLLALLPPLFLADGDWRTWAERGLIFLVVSCPCALVISIPLGFFGGIGGASRQGVLLKGGHCLETLNQLDTVVFDKTGTLTQGVFEVMEIETAADISARRLLEIAATLERFSRHPIAQALRRAWEKESGQPAATLESRPLADCREIAGNGIHARLGETTAWLGNARWLRAEGISLPAEKSGMGARLYLALDHQYAGSIRIADALRPDSLSAITGLRQRGIQRIVLLSGDTASAAQSVAEPLKLDTVFAECLPAQKLEHLERLAAQPMRKGGKIAFVGDGINDAPALARADLGVAMGGLGADAALEAADVVLMTDAPSRLLAALDIARATRRIVWQNITLALGVKGAFLLLAAVGVATLWEAVFADVGVALLAILNASRALRFKSKRAASTADAK
jgi:Cd2+/Zn2+-exporting ATPase